MPRWSVAGGGAPRPEVRALTDAVVGAAPSSFSEYAHMHSVVPAVNRRRRDHLLAQ